VATPDVTLVMPVWKPHATWFREAVVSALGQTGCEVELVVVDDGNDPPVAGSIPELDDPRVRLVHIEHAGQSEARNAGTAVARAPFLRNIDADDVLPPDGTALLLRHAAPDRIVYGYTTVCDEQLEPLYDIGNDLQGNVTADCVLGGFDMRHVSMLVPTTIARAAGPWDPDIGVSADWDFTLRCVEQAPVVGIPDVVTFYRRHDTSNSRRVGALTKARRGQRRVLEKYFERHPEARATPLHRDAWIAFHTTWARRAWRERAMGSFVREALALTRHDPRRVLTAGRRFSPRSSR